MLPEPPLDAVPRAGTSASAGEVVAPVGEGLRIGLYGPTGASGTAISAARILAEQVLGEAINASNGGMDDTLLIEVAAELDHALHRHFSPVGPSGRGTLCLAALADERATIVHTRDARAYLFRDKGLVARSDREDVDAHVGGRGREPEPLHLATVSWNLQPGDRLVLTTCSLDAFSPAELWGLVGQGSCEGAAQSLGALLRIRGQDPAIAVSDLAERGELQELDTQDTSFEDVLTSLQDVLPELARAETEHADEERSVVTDGFAPMRGWYPETPVDDAPEALIELPVKPLEAPEICDEGPSPVPEPAATSPEIVSRPAATDSSPPMHHLDEGTLDSTEAERVATQPTNPPDRPWWIWPAITAAVPIVAAATLAALAALAS